VIGHSDEDTHIGHSRRRTEARKCVMHQPLKNTVKRDFSHRKP